MEHKKYKIIIMENNKINKNNIINNVEKNKSIKSNIFKQYGGEKQYNGFIDSDYSELQYKDYVFFDEN